jgi:hypothetical protein
VIFPELLGCIFSGDPLKDFGRKLELEGACASKGMCLLFFPPVHYVSKGSL